MSRTKTVLVTGGSRGLGRDMVLNLAQKGLDVIFTYHTQEERAKAVIAEVEALGRTAVAYRLDTRDTSSFDAFVVQVTTHLKHTTGEPHLDFLVNNAGTALYASITDTTEAQLQEAFDIHFKGVFMLTQKFLPYLRAEGGIVTITSGLTRIIPGGTSVYAAMKAAVETYTQYLAKELGPRRIRANSIAPGAIETDFGGGNTRDNQEANARIAHATALGRAGLPTDIGSVVAFLCTPEAGWINAQRIEVSGGQMI